MRDFFPLIFLNMPLKIKYNRLEEVTNKLSNLEKAVKLGHLNTALDVAGEVPSLIQSIPNLN